MDVRAYIIACKSKVSNRIEARKLKTYRASIIDRRRSGDLTYPIRPSRFESAKAPSSGRCGEGTHHPVIQDASGPQPSGARIAEA